MSENDMDLIEWLRAQLDEDERNLRAHQHWSEQPWTLPDVLRQFMTAELKAKRAILDLHAPTTDGQGRMVCDHCYNLCHSRSGLACDDPDAPFPCETVSLFAQPFAGRDGWRDEWTVG